MLINTYLPKNKYSNEDLKAEFPDWNYTSFEKKVGIKYRHTVDPDETAVDLAIKASLPLFEKTNKNDIDFVLLCTQSPDYFLPTSACIIQDKLGLSTNCGALDFNLGCSGYIYGLSLAKGLLQSGIANKLLFIVAETYSKHIHPLDKTNRSIFGDGAAATILDLPDAQNIEHFVLKTDGNGADKLIIKNGACKIPYDSKPVTKTYGDNNSYSDNHLYMNGPDIFNFTIEHIPPLIEETLLKNNYSIEDIDLFIFHQANGYMLNTLRKIIKIPKEKFYVNMYETGNTVSATIPIALNNAMKDGIISKGSKVLLAGFGVGLSWGATILTLK